MPGARNGMADSTLTAGTRPARAKIWFRMPGAFDPMWCTTQIGVAKSAGNPATSIRRASTPPDEAPTTITRSTDVVVPMDSVSSGSKDEDVVGINHRLRLPIERRRLRVGDQRPDRRRRSPNDRNWRRPSRSTAVIEYATPRRPVETVGNQTVMPAGRHRRRAVAQGAACDILLRHRFCEPAAALRELV